MSRISSPLALILGIYTIGFFHFLSANLRIGFLRFGSQLFVAKLLTPIELGQVTVLQSFSAMAILVSGFGFNTAILKLCSENRLASEKSAIFRKNITDTLYLAACVLGPVSIGARPGRLSPDNVVNR